MREKTEQLVTLFGIDRGIGMTAEAAAKDVIKAIAPSQRDEVIQAAYDDADRDDDSVLADMVSALRKVYRFSI